MIVTLIGAIVLLAGLYLLFRARADAMLAYFFVCAMFGGSAVVKLTAVGNTSVQPAILAVLLLAIRTLWPGQYRGAAVGRALALHIPVLLFVAYGILSAIIMPRIFADTIMVPPLRPIPNHYIYAVYPLGPTTQNLTVSVYLVATLLAGVASYLAAGGVAAPQRIARTIAVCGILHALFGILSVVGRGTPLDLFFGFIRNGSYAQVDQEVGGFVRMNGVFPEPSIFCLTALILFAFLAELWIRNVDSRWSGPVALLLLAVMLMSTSTTAYVGVAAWAGLNLIRVLLFPGALRFGKLLAAGTCIVIGVLSAALMVATVPGALDQISDVISSVTVRKLEGRSGKQRLFYAQTGIKAFFHTGGLGIGAGSFRSSGILTAILGSMGIIGIVAFAVHWIHAFAPYRRNSYIPTGDIRADVGAAAGWAVLLMLVPTSLSSPSPDPGVVWGALCGLAIAFRRPLRAPATGGTPPG